MALLHGLGKILKGGLGPAAIGGAALYGVHQHYKNNWDPNDPNKPGLFSSIKEGLLDFAMGDATADIDMMGFPITPVDVFGSVLPAPQAALDFGRAMDATRSAYDNGGVQNIFQNMIYTDRLNKWYENQAIANVNRGYRTIDSPGSGIDSIPYAPQYSRQGYDVGADGSMVFGMYNLRQG